jgi:hypothetical protein
MDPSNQTATGMGIIASESNMRHKLRMKLAQLGFRRVAKHIYCLDRAMGSPIMGVPVPKGFAPEPGQEGVSASQGMAMVPQYPTYGPGMHYEVDVDAGAMAPPGQSEQAQKVRAFAMDASANPVLAEQTDWRAVGEMLAESHGLDPNRVFMQQPAGNSMAAMPAGIPEGAPVEGPPPDAGVSAPVGMSAPMAPPMQMPPMTMPSPNFTFNVEDITVNVPGGDGGGGKEIEFVRDEAGNVVGAKTVGSTSIGVVE